MVGHSSKDIQNIIKYLYTTSLDVCQSHHAGYLSEDRVLYGIPPAVRGKRMVNLMRESCAIVLDVHVARRNVHVVGFLLLS